ncbi:Candidapepsin-1 [Podospora fimiseda]|uniref:Candidapepsin-1 n=1 Tax=Podospora fimiseda TaxID=252190 RepID=A0AAN7H840_9PEZI|nr:Candidapepsin-1 [Podospora fimiseda]
MLATAVLTFLLCLAVCHGAVIQSRNDTAPGSGDGAGGDGDGERWKRPSRQRPGYLRYPVSRHKVNGTGKWKWGWHWSPPPGFTREPRPSWQTESPFQTTSPGARPSRTWARSSWPTVLPTSSRSTSTHPFWPGATISSLSTLTRPSAIQSTSLSPTEEPAGIQVYQRVTDRRWGWTSLEELGGIVYIIQLEIGTPPQKVRVFIDTGSYELWVNPRCSNSASEYLCQSFGTYFPNKSNSSTHIGGNFAVTYGTGSVRGSYWSDVMSIAMFEIPSVQFAVASDSTYTFAGILGLGYAYGYSIEYPTVLNLMVSRGMINAPIFSLGLGGDGDGFSELIFGGVNRWKFAGPLAPVKIWPPVSQQDPRWVQYWVNVTSVGMTKPGENPIIYTPRDTFSMPTLIDTGSTLSYIREDLVATIGQQFQATVDNAGNYFVDCSYRDLPGTVDFGFNRGGMVINVRYKDFIYQQVPGSKCMLGVQPADVGSTNYVLGDTFIRGAYCRFYNHPRRFFLLTWGYSGI